MGPADHGVEAGSRTTPRQTRPRAGAAIIPMAGRPWLMMATLTVNSSRPARNSRVPSSGSTRTNPASSAEGLASCSSDTIGAPGRRRAKSWTIMAFAASSAALTGERSGFARHSILDRSIARIAAAARDTTSVRSSSPLGPLSRASASRCVMPQIAVGPERYRAPQGTPLAARAASRLCSRSMARLHHRRCYFGAVLPAGREA